MNKSILYTENQNFINRNIDNNITKLLLQKHTDITVDIKLLVEQIEAKKRCENKLPTWFNAKNIYFPNKLNIEQTSSEITAEYKANLIKGDSLIDITGGFGVDSYYFSKSFKSVTHCEINQDLSAIVKHNYKQLGITNSQCFATDGMAYLKASNVTFSWVYIDPSRRHDQKGKVFFLKDCIPNVPESLEFIFKKTNAVLIKTAPLLDISAGIKELNHVKSIHVVAINNEVKELLWILEAGYSEAIKICTANLKKYGVDAFDFMLDNEAKAHVNFSQPLTYLYEPNAAILKAGAFNILSQQLNLGKLHQHTHLYTSKELVPFPGRCFKILSIIPYNKKEFKKTEITKANVTTRNFPESVQKIRKKLKINDGGDTYLFFTTNIHNERVVIICKKL